MSEREVMQTRWYRSDDACVCGWMRIGNTVLGVYVGSARKVRGREKGRAKVNRIVTTLPNVKTHASTLTTPPPVLIYTHPPSISLDSGLY